MTNYIVVYAIRFLLWLRYRIRIQGYRDIHSGESILFLPNHPALIDPLIICTKLYRRFKPRVLIDYDQSEPPIAKWIATQFEMIRMPDVRKHGKKRLPVILEAIRECQSSISNGRNIILYPAGYTYRSRRENLHGNSGVYRMLQAAPKIRIVLIRTTGLWGSAFSWSSGLEPDFFGVLKTSVTWVLKNLVFFGPRREVLVEFVEPKNFPRNGTIKEMNEALECFYNQSAPPNTYVPHTIREKGGVRVLPEPPVIGLIKSSLTPAAVHTPG